MKKVACNPVLPVSVCIADGEPHVFGDRVYLFGSHDTPGGESFCLEDYEFYSAPLNDLSDWTSKGTNYSAKQDPLYGDNAKYLYAPDVVQGNDGRYYLYYCLAGWKGDGTIRLYFGTGPFRGMEITPWNKFLLAKIYAGIFDKPVESFKQKIGPLGANAAVLEDDMLTLKEEPKRICDTRDFKGHSFFEGSSIRKVGDIYYFVYSSEKNHELCYATSKFPDHDFKYRGTIVSNGDVGYHGRKEKQRCNATGTTHGGMEKIGDKWYIFYHRLTHGCDYSRQMCAEPLEIMKDGSIPQVEMTSLGLNDYDLLGIGDYSCTICCNLTNGKMPHIANKICTDIPHIPHITHSGEEVFIKNAAKSTEVVYKYFSIESDSKLYLIARGNGTLQVYLNDNLIGDMIFNEEAWNKKELMINSSYKHSKLKLVVKEGTLDLLSFGFEK